MDLEPGVYHLKIRQGKTLRKVFTFKIAGVLVNLSGYTARAQVRQIPDASTALVDLSTANGGIALGGALGTITLILADTATANLTPINAVWELELIEPGGDVMSLLYGPATIQPEVVK